MENLQVALEEIEKLLIPDWASEDCRKEMAQIADPEVCRDLRSNKEKTVN